MMMKMNNEGSYQNAQTKNFFETHGSGEIVTALDVTLDMREDGVKRFDLIRKKSPIFKQALSIKGLKAHNRSMRALTASTYYIRCKKCENIPLVTQVVVFHTKGMERFFEDGTHISAPFPFDDWQIKDGFHFLIEYRCTHCFEAHSTIATFKRPIALLIQEYVKWTNQHNQHKNESGSEFMVKPSWIKTYFVEKKIDLKYAQKTASACIKRYLDIKNARNKHQLSGMSFDKEVIEGIMVIRSGDVIPKITELVTKGTNESAFPSSCPSCGSEVKRDGVNLICTGSICRDRDIQSIRHWIKITEIEGLGPKSVAKLYDEGLVTHFADLFDSTLPKNVLVG